VHKSHVTHTWTNLRFCFVFLFSIYIKIMEKKINPKIKSIKASCEVIRKSHFTLLHMWTKTIFFIQVFVNTGLDLQCE